MCVRLQQAPWGGISIMAKSMSSLQTVLHDIEELLLAVAAGGRCCQCASGCFGSFGFFEPQGSCLALIEHAYASKEKEWIASALFAMGRSGN